MTNNSMGKRKKLLFIYFFTLSSDQSLNGGNHWDYATKL